MEPKNPAPEYVNIFTVFKYEVFKANARVTPKQYWLKDRNPAFGNKMRIEKHEVALNEEDAVSMAVMASKLRHKAAVEEMKKSETHLKLIEDLADRFLPADI
jgi:hypothetical protein